jgi:Zn-dependent peptidase ImmA (M78 family)/transcriptional regulator with XRE-family HTH domain
MNPKELATRLRNARETCGISQLQAAEAIGLPRTAITQIEGGNRSVSTLELTKLAKLYRHSISYFLDEAPSREEDIDKMLYRARTSLNKSPRFKEQIHHYINLCKAGMVLEKMLQFETRIGPPRYSISVPKTKSEAVTQGTIIANQERNRLNLGINQVGDLASLISNQGIWACGADLPDDISGLFLNNPQTGMIILVNATHVKARKRFSYAHEYAHALFDRDENIRISSSENNSELIEVRANAFAAAFLMPADGIMEVLRNLNKGRSSREEQVVFDVSANSKMNIESRSTPFSQNITFQDIAIIAHHFGVSYHAAVYRLRSLNFISSNECDKLIASYQDGKRLLTSINMLSDIEDEEKKEFWDRELRSELAYLTIEAFRREEISRGRVIELGDEIGIGGKELYEFALATIDKSKNDAESVCPTR